MLYNTTRQRWARVALAVLGSLIYSIGINYFVTPAGLYSGGFLGVGQIIRTLLITNLGLNFGSLDVAGLIYFALNIPVYLIAFRSISGHFGIKSLLCTICNTAFLSLLTPPAEPILRRAGFLDSGRHHCRRRHRPDALRRRLFRRHGYPGRISHEKSPRHVRGPHQYGF